MRIAVLYTDDVFSNSMLRPLLLEGGLEKQIVCICKDTSFNSKMLHALFSPKNEYSLNFIAANVFINAIGSLHKSFIKGKSFLSLARKKGIPIKDCADFNSPSTIDFLKEKKPQLIINKASQILRKEILEIPDLGCYNIHASLLPEYKGWVASFWVLQRGEKETGVTIHRINEEIDAGSIIRQKKIPIGPGDTYYSLQKKCVREAAKLLADLVKDEDFSPLTDVSQGQGSYFGFPKKEDMQRFRDSGNRLINSKEIITHILNGF
ncbi:MAG: hypothetical protein JW869_03070 [Candidatus Omnitrophica bacterium]|nr:hypothetical protein [Candidatus Omnitrophota bacterium]